MITSVLVTSLDRTIVVRDECPRGRAWFDEASSTDEAHADNVECSNAGIV